jgi:hypothetical protein
MSRQPQLARERDEPLGERHVRLVEEPSPRANEMHLSPAASRTRPSTARLSCSFGLGLSLCACGASSESADEFGANAPVVLATSPRDGERSVDPALAQVTATFSEAMDPIGWSWVTEVGRSTPSITGLPFYLDESTTVLPVRLEPATAYVLWVNSPDDEELRKFTSVLGVSARAYRIRFTTRSAE